MLTVLSLLSLAQIVISVPVVPTTSPPSAAPSTPIQELPPPQPAPPQLVPTPQPQVEVVRPQEIRALPGQLDDVPVFNSNSPELIQTEGILLSTFPPNRMRVPAAHLNFPLEGRFDLFAHHIAKGVTPDDVRTLYLGIVVYNPSNEPVTIDILQAASYLSQDAPFFDLPAYVANPMGNVYAGPGSRMTNDILRGERQPHWPAQITIPPKQTYLMVNVPIPLRRLTVPTDGTLPPGYVLLPSPPAPTQVAVSASTTPAAPELPPVPSAVSLVVPAANAATAATAAARPRPGSSTSRPAELNREVPINGRSILMHLSSDGPVHIASLAMYAPKTASGSERVPTLAEWNTLLTTGGFAGPRDRSPTPPDRRNFVRFFYGRVAGVAQGTQWTALATDDPDTDHLSIPAAGNAISYVLSTVDHNTFGTGQVQSAPMLVRYPDTAYRAHGNYGVQYNISLPLYNGTDSTKKVAILLQTPLQNERSRDALTFREPPDNQIFFRGTVRLRYTDDFGIPQTRYIHVVQRRGQEGDPLLRLTMPPRDRRLVEFQFVYPPDATPPQVLTIETQEGGSLANNRQ